MGTSIITTTDATLSVTATGGNIENVIVKNIVLNQFEDFETFTGTEEKAPKNLNIQITARLGTVADGTVTVAASKRCNSKLNINHNN